MLHVSAPFPHAGSEAFVAPDAVRARILRDNGDGTCLIQLTEGRDLGRGAVEAPDIVARVASGNRTEPRANLFETRKAAIEAARRGHVVHDDGTPRQSRKARRPAKRGAGRSSRGPTAASPTKAQLRALQDASRRPSGCIVPIKGARESAIPSLLQSLCDQGWAAPRAEGEALTVITDEGRRILMASGQ